MKIIPILYELDLNDRFISWPTLYPALHQLQFQAQNKLPHPEIPMLIAKIIVSLTYSGQYSCYKLLY
jgi:hypothetical protein